ncbi:MULTISPECIES: Acg family FMN-binding oxidoreductase [Hyphobacterium]|uniref:Acg family FMN-binding oxidoreductase n=1 Tax=Hyphobacterium vulgare TaxID=1736751 RepID=A0ABV6ZVS5_9PROT
MPSRRTFLLVAGSSAVILAAGAAGFALTRDPLRARRPWHEAGTYPDPMRRALSWALLAPNPHNRQPWLVDIISAHEAVLHCQLDRRLPETDPFDRQITIGLGAFLELFRMAAAEDGLSAQFDLFPDGSGQDGLDARPVARLRLEPGGRSDPLFVHAPGRRTNRTAYDLARPVPAAVLDAIAAAPDGRVESGCIDDPAEVQTLRDLCWQASEIEQRTPHTWQETVDLMRIGKAEINRNPDGIALPGAMPDLLRMTGLMTRETMSDQGSLAYQQSLDLVESWARTAMAFIWLRTAGNTREEQIRSGAAYLRVALAAEREGIAIQPMSQALQEFPEMAEPYAEIHRRLAPEGGTVQMFARLGYAAPVPSAPRWGLETRLR